MMDPNGTRTKDLLHTVQALIHVINFKGASGRFSFHFREVYEKCIVNIGKYFIQMREISKY